MRNLLSLLAALALSGCSVLGIRSGYEQPPYVVSDSFDSIEIRDYKPRLAIEASGYEDRSDAFRALFRYISGANVGAEQISMTSPVEISDEKAGQKIAMTSPVEMNESGDTVMMRFFLPKKFSYETAPRPTNEKLELKLLAGESFAVLRYSGSNSEKKFSKMKKKLLEQLESSTYEPVGQPTFLGYDPPFTLPFLKRNEAIVRVTKKNDS